MKYGTPWSRDELVLALYLYCQIPFARTKANNPEVIRLARILGRTPASVARKLGNFGAFDQRLAAQGITGLTHVSKADREVWNAFYQQWDSLVENSLHLLAKLKAEPIPDVRDDTPVISRPAGKTERGATVLVRVGQAFFRRTVLSSYEHVCCVCQIDLPELLVASHIIPWSVSEDKRTDPENGLCLCALHDKAFDKGFMSFSEDLKVVVSPMVSVSTRHFTKVSIVDFGGRPMKLPRRFLPRPEFLSWHRSNVFRS